MLETIGKRLKETRQAKGLSIEDVHKKTRIHPKMLVSLEEGGPCQEIGAIYVKSFLKKYCEFLGINFEEIWQQYEPKINITKTTSLEVSQKKEKSAFSPQLPRLTGLGKYLKKIILIVISLALVWLVFGWLRRVIENFAHRGQQSALLSKEKTAKKGAALEKPRTISGPLKLTAKVKVNTWAKIKQDGKTVVSGVLKKGQTENWQAEEQFEIELGNFQGIELKLNGEVISDLKSAAGKRIIISHEGVKFVK
jgi:cytoskeletal protein RodZ